ncbi:CAF1-7 [Scenedesmus sp. PABB004]|nr:CAF1-7 [Scenedesmus sp. PABB004]
MCGPTRPALARLDGADSRQEQELPVLALPKGVALNSLAAAGRRSSGSSGDDADSRSSSPRATGHAHARWSQIAPDGAAAALKQLADPRQQRRSSSKQQAAWPAGGAGGPASPSVSPRSACSTPGGADNSMGLHLHALVFDAPSRHAAAAARRPGACELAAAPGACSSASFASRQQQLLGANRRYPARNRTSSDLRRSSQDSCAHPWARRGGGGPLLASVAALGLAASPTAGRAAPRGSISKAKLVLAEAINSMPGAHGLRDYSPATCDAGVLAPLLSIIRHNGATSRRSSFTESAASTCSSTSTGAGFAAGAAPRGAGGGGRRSRAGSADGAALDDAAAALGGLVPPTLHEDAPAALDGDAERAAALAAARARAAAAAQQKVVDCIDTVKYLAMDDSNRVALIDLGAVELLLAKLQPGAAPAPEVAASALAALPALAKHDAVKAQLWEAADAGVLLRLLRGRTNTPVVKAAHGAVAQLCWSVDGGGGCGGGAAGCGGGSVFDSISSGAFSSTDSASSSCSGANVLLEPRVVPALAACLHPAADVPVLLSALKLLSKAAASVQPETPAPPPGAGSIGAARAGAARAATAGWHTVLFALMPLLIPNHRRQGHLVLGAALELLVVLTEQHPALHAAVCASGCLPPLLAQMAEGDGERSLQAACILTGLVDVRPGAERLSQEPAVAVLLRVLQDAGKGVDVRLAAVHMLRRLAATVPRAVPLLKLHCAVPVVVALLRSVPDADVRRAAAGLLQLLGTPVVVRARRSLDDGSRVLPGTAGAGGARPPCAGLAGAAGRYSPQQRKQQHSVMVAQTAASSTSPSRRAEPAAPPPAMGVEGLTGTTENGETLRVREVWNDNLGEEIAVIRNIVEEYPYVAMDTEFPGVVARPVGNFKSSREYHYKALKINVDMLKLIQLGLTFTDAEGNLPVCGGEHTVWQFNFRGFRLSEDVYAQDSIELLKQSGIDFAQNEARGIDVSRFGELLMSSGIVLNEEIRWITFHSGYDFGYLLKVLTAQPLPAAESEFFELLNLYFPNVFDIKYLMKFCDNLHGGLNKLAELLDVQRIGPQHQAGSDSLLTSLTFIKLAQKFFSGVEGASKHMGVLYGLGVDGAEFRQPDLTALARRGAAAAPRLATPSLPRAASRACRLAVAAYYRRSGATVHSRPQGPATGSAEQRGRQQGDAGLAKRSKNGRKMFASTRSVKFHVRYKTDFGQEVYLVGNCAALGNWDVMQASPARRAQRGSGRSGGGSGGSGGGGGGCGRGAHSRAPAAQGVRLTWSAGHIWQGSVELPAGLHIQYKYVVRAGAEVLRWQEGDNVSLEMPGGQAEALALDVEDSWNQAKQVKRVLAAGTSVRFNIRVKVDFGQVLLVVGSCASLGSWNTDAAVRLNWQEGHVWEASVELPAGEAVDYKYVVRNADGTMDRWQPGENLRMDVPVAQGNNGRRRGVLVLDSWTKSHRRANRRGPYAGRGAPGGWRATPPSGQAAYAQTADGVAVHTDSPRFGYADAAPGAGDEAGGVAQARGRYSRMDGGAGAALARPLDGIRDTPVGAPAPEPGVMQHWTDKPRFAANEHQAHQDPWGGGAAAAAAAQQQQQQGEAPEVPRVFVPPPRAGATPEEHARWQALQSVMAALQHSAELDHWTDDPTDPRMLAADRRLAALTASLGAGAAAAAAVVA